MASVSAGRSEGQFLALEGWKREDARVLIQYPPEALALPKLATHVLPYFSRRSRTAPQIVSESTTAPPPLSMRRTTAPIVSSSPASLSPRTIDAVPNLQGGRKRRQGTKS